MRPRGTQEGMTLIELLMALVLASVVLIGAFHIASTFQNTLHRQDDITRVQQTMKVTRQMLERRIRAAGAGMTGTAVVGCGGERQVGPFVLHNSNVFGTTDTTDGGDDPDPDWFEVMAGSITQSGFLTSSSTVSSVNKTVDNAANFVVGQLMGLKNENGVCIFMVSSVNPNNGQIKYQASGGGPLGPLLQCYNSSASFKNQLCRNDTLKSNQLPAGSEILNFSAGTFAMRIDDSDPNRPTLMMATGVAHGDPNLYQWQAVAENVEDMQIAVHVDTSSPSDDVGDLWVTSRDLTDAELSKVRMVRISLVFRTASTVSGWTSGRRPALEDRVQAPATDGYVRRVLSTVIKLRNRTQEVGP